jgi:DNA-binding response OmpR family regulator
LSAQSVNGESTGQARLRVLVADDEPPIRLLCQVNLALAGMEVLQAEDGDQAVALARAELPDILLLDLMMPKLDGWSVAETLKEDESTRDIPVLFLTARATSADVRRATELGALGYILKPFDPVRLAPLVAEVVERCERGEAEEIRHERPSALWPADLGEA